MNDTPGALTADASPDNWTDPEKLPALPVVVELVLGMPTALQLPKGAPACNKFISKAAVSSFKMELCSRIKWKLLQPNTMT